MGVGQLFLPASVTNFRKGKVRGAEISAANSWVLSPQVACPGPSTIYIYINNIIMKGGCQHHYFLRGLKGFGISLKTSTDTPKKVS